MTKAQERMYDSYIRATATSLSDVYKSWSGAKQRAWEYCEGLRKRLDGDVVRVPSANTFQFTYAFKYYDYDTNHVCLCYCTASHNYMFPID